MLPYLYGNTGTLSTVTVNEWWIKNQFIHNQQTEQFNLQAKHYIGEQGTELILFSAIMDNSGEYK